MKKQSEDYNFDILELEGGGFKLSKGVKAKLLEMQMNTAMKGNAEMLKWLGKQYLGQTDKAETNEYANKPLPFND